MGLHALHLAVCLLAAGAAHAGLAAPHLPLDSSSAAAFTAWMVQHGKPAYESQQEHDRRHRVWQGNAAFIQQHMANNPSVQLALNAFADLTWEEFKSTRLGFKGEAAKELRAKKLSSPAGSVNSARPFRYADTTAPASIDWRARGAVTPVKDQGACGSCWSFSATGAIEGVNFIKTGKLVSLSEQQLVDCDTAQDQGCGGGLMDFAYQYVIDNHGLDTEADYAYWSGFGMTLWMCNRRKEADRTVVSIDDFEGVPEGEESLAKAVAHQPVSVGICAGPALQFYSGGVLDSCCNDLNHGVLAVGYDTNEAGTPYWIVKNSWGEAWGKEGYFHLKKDTGAGGLCGIATVASIPIKSTPNHPVPEMCDIFGWTECPAGNSCSCSFSLFGLLCLWHDCCPIEGGVTCADLLHCCPGEAPVCDMQQGTCVSEDGRVSVPWTAKTKAQVSAAGAPKNPFISHPFARTPAVEDGANSKAGNRKFIRPE